MQTDQTARLSIGARPPRLEKESTSTSPSATTTPTTTINPPRRLLLPNLEALQWELNQQLLLLLSDNHFACANPVLTTVRRA